MVDRVHISVDARQVDKELDRLSKAPDMKTEIAFNALFAEITAEVMALIHVETGSLKSTTKWEVDALPTAWQGTVRVGGAAPGEIRDPAYYGVYELARGGSHFFFAPAYSEVPSKMISIILDFYKGGEAGGLQQDIPPVPSPGSAAKLLSRSARAVSGREAKTIARRISKAAKEASNPSTASSGENPHSLSGRSGEGLARASRKPEAESKRIKPHPNTRRRRK